MKRSTSTSLSTGSKAARSSSASTKSSTAESIDGEDEEDDDEVNDEADEDDEDEGLGEDVIEILRLKKLMQEKKLDNENKKFKNMSKEDVKKYWDDK